MVKTQTSWKWPPRAKIYEALSALVDDRVVVVAEGEASVASSDRAKNYVVVWSDDRSAFGSNDNASYWVGYIGYPVIATMMKLGLLQPKLDLAAHLAGINWNEINRIYKRDYDAAVDFVLEGIERAGGDAGAIRADASRLYDELKVLKIGRITSGPPPAKG